MRLAYLARISGWESALVTPSELAQLRDERINEGMKALFDNGCRRMRVSSLPRTGDDTKWAIFGSTNRHGWAA